MYFLSSYLHGIQRRPFQSTNIFKSTLSLSLSLSNVIALSKALTSPRQTRLSLKKMIDFVGALQFAQSEIVQSMESIRSALACFEIHRH